MIRLFCILRGIFVVLVVPVLTVIWATVAILGAAVSKSKSFRIFIMSSWSKIILFLSNVKIVTEGEENLPEEGCLFVFNHTSYYDVLGIAAPMKKLALFGAKSELFKIPFFGHAMAAFGLLPIHRGDRERVLSLYEKSVVKIKGGGSYILAGEGGRHKDAGDVGDKFKTGPFIFAITAQCPIVPYVIQGAREAHSRSDWVPNPRQWRTEIHCKILPPVPTTGLSLDDRNELAEKVRKLMADACTEA